MVLPTSAREPRQARKGATVAVSGVWRGRLVALMVAATAAMSGHSSKCTAQDTTVIIETPPVEQPDANAPVATPPVEHPPDDAPLRNEAKSDSERTPIIRAQPPSSVEVHGTKVQLRLRGAQEGIRFFLSRGRAESTASGFVFDQRVGYPFGFPYGYGYPYGFRYGPYGYGVGGWGGPAFTPYAFRTSTEIFQTVCQAPCDASVASGQHTFALALHDGPPIRAGDIDVQTPATLVGHYTSRKKIRRAGWILFGLGVIAGTAMVAASLDYDTFDDDIRFPALFGSGLGVLVGSIVGGSVMASRRDVVRIEVQ